MIFHYTARPQAQAAIKDGALKAHPVRVCPEHLIVTPKSKYTVLSPVVWFSASPWLDGTIEKRESLFGYDRLNPGDFWRFSVHEGVVPVLTMIEWGRKHNYHPDLFKNMFWTAHLVGSDWNDWRLCERDVPRYEWRAVERWSDGGTGAWGWYEEVLK